MLEDLEYLRWAHERYGLVRLDLASSGVPHAPAAMLGPVTLDDFHAPRAFADAVAERYGLRSDEVTPALGASQAVWLACAALLEPGDEVLVETPTYEPLRRVPAGLGARVRTFRRSATDGWAVDVCELRAHLTERTRLVLVSSPHNPSGIPIPRETLGEMARACAGVDATLLVDEVYAEFLPGEPRSARTAGANVVAVSSLTKRWGLGWARAGWVAASPGVVERILTAMRHGAGIVGTVSPALGLAALRNLPALTERADRILGDGAERVDAWVRSHASLSWTRPPGGPFGLVRVEGATDLRPAIEEVARRHGVLVAPGSFFGVPDAFRIGWTAADDALAEGLDLLGRHLLDQ